MNTILYPFRRLGLWSDSHSDILTVQGTTYRCTYCFHKHLNGIKEDDWACCAETFNKYSIQNNTLHRELGKRELFNESWLLAIMEQFLKEEFISAADKQLVKCIQSSDDFFCIDAGLYSSNKYVMLALVKNNPYYLEYASTRLKDDPEVVGAAVEHNRMMLEFASDTIKNNREVVLKAVKQNGWALKHASSALKNDKTVVLEAVKQDGDSLEYASDILKNDIDVVLVAIGNSETALSNASDEVRNNKDIAMVAVKAHARAFIYVGDSLKYDKELALEAVKKDGQMFLGYSKTLRNDRDIVLAALEQFYWMLQWVSKEFQDQHPDIIDNVISSHPQIAKYDLRTH